MITDVDISPDAAAAAIYFSNPQVITSNLNSSEISNKWRFTISQAYTDTLDNEDSIQNEDSNRDEEYNEEYKDENDRSEEELERELKSEYEEYKNEGKSNSDITVIRGAVESEEEFNPKGVWGPIKARLIPDTKRTLAKLVSADVSQMSSREYRFCKDLAEYLMNNENSKQRVFELTGFDDKDLEVAHKYFKKYSKMKGVAAKGLKLALSTSSNGKVSKQIGGLTQFLFELSEVDGKPIPEELRYRLFHGLTPYLREIWQKLPEDCLSEDPQMCKDKKKEYLDLDEDGDIDEKDAEIGLKSVDFVEEKIYEK